MSCFIMYHVYPNHGIDNKEGINFLHATPWADVIYSKMLVKCKYIETVEAKFVSFTLQPSPKNSNCRNAKKD